MNFIKYDSPFGRAMNRIVDLFVLLCLTILCCAPVITAGAALTALYYVLLKIVRMEEGNIVSQFFKGFKENFWKATLLWLVVGGFFAVFYIDIMLLNQRAIDYGDVERIVLIIIAAIVLMISSYIFPLQAQFENRVGGTIKNAFLLSIMNFPRSLELLALRALPIVVMLFLPETIYFLPVLCIVLVPYFSTQILIRIFDKYMPEVTGEQALAGIKDPARQGRVESMGGNVPTSAAFGALSEDELPETVRDRTGLPEDDGQDVGE